MSFLNYLKFSNLRIAIDLNPFVWKIRYEASHPEENDTDPNLHIWKLWILFLSFHLVIDNGKFLKYNSVVFEDIPDVGEDQL